MEIAKSPDVEYSVQMNSEPILSFVLRRLAENKGRLREIASASGVPYSTVSKIHQRVTANPGVKAVQDLADYFQKDA